MKYKIYRIVSEDDGLSIVNDAMFEFREFESMEEAYEEIKNTGLHYIEYTILPSIFKT